MLRGSTHAWKVGSASSPTRPARDRGRSAIPGSVSSPRSMASAPAALCEAGARAEIWTELAVIAKPAARHAHGTGGLTRVVDKRKVRHDLAGVFSTVAEGVKGRRAVSGGSSTRFIPPASSRPGSHSATELAAVSDRPDSGPGSRPHCRRPSPTPASHAARSASSSIARPGSPLFRCGTTDPSRRRRKMLGEGGRCSRAHSVSRARRYVAAPALRQARSARHRETTGRRNEVLAVDGALVAHRQHWFVRESSAS